MLLLCIQVTHERLESHSSQITTEKGSSCLKLESRELEDLEGIFVVCEGLRKKNERKSTFSLKLLTKVSLSS